MFKSFTNAKVEKTEQLDNLNYKWTLTQPYENKVGKCEEQIESNHTNNFDLMVYKTQEQRYTMKPQVQLM